MLMNKFIHVAERYGHMQVITLMNSKGGVGKTTAAETIGAGLAILGYRALLLDTDYQRFTITSALGMDKEPAFTSCWCAARHGRR